MARDKLRSDTYTALEEHHPSPGGTDRCCCGQWFNDHGEFLQHQAEAVVDAVAPLLDSLLTSLARANGRSPEAERIVRFGLPALGARSRRPELVTS